MPHLVLQGFADGVPREVQELTAFNTPTSKKLQSSAHGSYFQVTVTVGLLFRSAAHDFWSPITYFLFIKLHWVFLQDTIISLGGNRGRSYICTPLFPDFYHLKGKGKENKILKPQSQILLGHKAELQRNKLTADGEKKQPLNLWFFLATGERGRNSPMRHTKASPPPPTERGRERGSANRRRLLFFSSLPFPFSSQPSPVPLLSPLRPAGAAGSLPLQRPL